MDNGLVPGTRVINLATSEGLNPCCSGRRSRTRPYKTLLIINKLKNVSKEIFTALNRNLTIS